MSNNFTNWVGLTSCGEGTKKESRGFVCYDKKQLFPGRYAVDNACYAATQLALQCSEQDSSLPPNRINSLLHEQYLEFNLIL